MADDNNTRPVDPDASTKDLGQRSSAALPKKIGHYSIKSILGSGGMGTVYLAQQESPRRAVALKIMKKGIASKSALRRFEFESQILARLKHPNIAQVYEAGTHDDGEGGVPFFAMEYIPSAKPITKYAQDNSLSMNERLKLFAKVCAAVHHGHQKGIIHRDLKPGNILVDSQSEPKIIDFGVARATDSDLAITTLQTDIGQLIGTLQYMSPEQCEGDPHDLDTRSDVYALGVVLYELLTDSLPYDLTHIALHEAARVIREETPAKPSSINKTLRGDVETITLKAIEKRRDHRYQSASELGADVRRFINGDPIAARPPSLADHMGRIIRRNRGIVALLLLVFTSLLVVPSILRNRNVDAEINQTRYMLEMMKAQFELGVMVSDLSLDHVDLRNPDFIQENQNVRRMLELLRDSDPIANSGRSDLQIFDSLHNDRRSDPSDEKIKKQYAALNDEAIESVKTSVQQAFLQTIWEPDHSASQQADELIQQRNAAYAELVDKNLVLSRINYFFMGPNPDNIRINEETLSFAGPINSINTIIYIVSISPYAIILFSLAGLIYWQRAIFKYVALSGMWIALLIGPFGWMDSLTNSRNTTTLIHLTGWVLLGVGIFRLMSIDERLRFRIMRTIYVTFTLLPFALGLVVFLASRFL